MTKEKSKKTKNNSKRKNRWRRTRHRVVKSLVYLLSPLCKLWYGAKVERMKRPGKRPYLLLSNHQTAFDQFFVGMVYLGPVYYVASEDLFSNGFISRMLEWAVRPIPIRKQTTDVRAVMTCLKVAKEGGTIAISPEGNRTYSGRTEHINPAIGGLVKLLRLPVAFIRIEGGYGVQPRWADNVRKGKMRVYVSRIMEPEEYRALPEEEIAAIIQKELYVDDLELGGTFISKKSAEYMDRAYYVCPDCGLSTFHAEGEHITCKKCGKTWRYLPDRTFDQGPFRNTLEWYDFQTNYVNSLDLLQREDELLYEEHASMKEVVLYKNKLNMENFWDFSVWGSFNVIAILLISLLVANALKRLIKPLGNSLIPTSVLGGIMLLIISSIYTGVTKEYLFDTQFFGGNGAAFLEILTYHTLALGFIASTLKTTKGKMNKQRGVEIFNTGVTTVATYLLQGIFGLAITILAAFVIPEFFKAAGILLPFGYGQGSGQAMNYGNIYETQYGFEGGKSFGLSVAALGFLSAAIGGVIHLNIIRKKGRMRRVGDEKDFIPSSEVHNEGDIPMNQGIDKITIQIAFIALAYVLSYLLMYGLGLLLPTMKATVYGFNFFLGVLAAVIVKAVVNFFHKKNVIKKQYTNNFLLTRISNFFFDIMIVAGIAAIKLDTLAQYWHILLILGVVGLVITYFYNIWVARKLFPRYSEEQFLVMYGMLTGTASTGVILLRELDPDLATPAAENLVYQNFPAMVFGFPMMLLATFAPENPEWTLLIITGFFIVMNIILFRNQIFRRKKKDAPPAPPAE